MELAQRARAAGVSPRPRAAADPEGFFRYGRTVPARTLSLGRDCAGASADVAARRVDRRRRVRHRRRLCRALDRALLHLAERGVKTVVLEAHEPGWGGSGRNGGQVIPGLKYDPDELVEKFPRRGEELVAFAGGTADAVFDL